MKPAKSCHSCLMPFNKDPGQKESDIYCSLCFKGGELIYKGDNVQEFKKICYKGMLERGINKYLAIFYTFLIGFAPRWKQANENKNHKF